MENNKENEVELSSERLEENLDQVDTIHEFNPPVKHSGLGIASFSLAILSIILTFVLLTLAATAFADLGLDPANPAFQEQLENIETNSQLIGIMLSFLLVGAFIFIGLVLGIIGLFMKNRKKLFAILGTILNLIPFAFTLIIFILALFI